MLKRNWNLRNNRLFCHIFVIGEITIGGACVPPLAYAYAPIEENKIGVRKFSARFLAYSNEISTVQEIVLSSSRGQCNFRGLEASRPRPRTSKCVLEDVLEAKDVLENSTSDLGEHQTHAKFRVPMTGGRGGIFTPRLRKIGLIKRIRFLVLTKKVIQVKFYAFN